MSEPQKTDRAGDALMVHPILQFKLPDGRWDMDGYARSEGETVPAALCPNCGKFARVVAGDSSVRDAIPGEPEPSGPWKRTDCKRCGVWEVEKKWNPTTGWTTKRKDRL